MSVGTTCRCKPGYTVVCKKQGRWWCTYCDLPLPEDTP